MNKPKPPRTAQAPQEVRIIGGLWKRTLLPAPAALALPTDRVKLPSEKDLFLFGRTEGAAAEVAKQDFSGSYGYVME